MSSASTVQQLFPDFRNFVIIQHEAAELRQRAESYARAFPIVATALRNQATVLASKAREAWLDRVRQVAPRQVVSVGPEGVFRVGEAEFRPDAVTIPTKA